MNHPNPPGFVTAPLRSLLRVEGLAVFFASIAAYVHSGAGLWTFLALVLVPDVAFLGYLAGPRVGAAAYNTTHSYVGPALLAGAALVALLPASLLPYAAIWTAHIGVDRALGYGLKYPTAFGDTHLGPLSKRARELAAAASTKEA